MLRPLVNWLNVGFQCLPVAVTLSTLVTSVQHLQWKYNIWREIFCVCVLWWEIFFVCFRMGNILCLCFVMGNILCLFYDGNILCLLMGNILCLCFVMGNILCLFYDGNILCLCFVMGNLLCWCVCDGKYSVFMLVFTLWGACKRFLCFIKEL